MQEFRFYHPIVIRFSDLDAQRHVNNARYFTFLEDAETGDTFATGRSILVAYDYGAEDSIPIPDRWRKTLLAYDGK